MQDDEKIKSTAKPALLDRLCTPEEAKELFELSADVKDDEVNLLEDDTADNIKAKWLRAHMVRMFYKHCNKQKRPDIFCQVIRKLYNLSQEEFALRLGFTTDLIENIEANLFNFYVEDLDTLCQFEEAAAGFFLLRNSEDLYECDDEWPDDEAGNYIGEVKNLWNLLNHEIKKIYAEEKFVKLPGFIQ